MIMYHLFRKFTLIVIKEYSFKHTAYKSRVGQNTIFSNGLQNPEIVDWNPLNLS